MTATALKEIDVTVSSVRVPPVLRADAIKLDSAGYEFRTLVIRLPDGATVEDLKTPSYFRKVQLSSLALLKLDEVRLLAFDESWMVRAIVAEATPDGATLADFRIVALTPRQGGHFQDENYRIAWTGAGYQVIRKKDSMPMAPAVQTVALAEAELRRQYPERQGGVLR